MTTLADRIAAQVRRPTITMRLDGRRCTRVLRARVSQAYGSTGISGGTVVLRRPPIEPAEGMRISWTWGYDGYEAPGFTGYVTRITDNSYPDTWELEVQDVLWLAQREQRPIVASPLNNITANDAIEYILDTYAGLTRVSLPTIARPSTGGTWTLGALTPVSWDKTTALAACQDIAAAAGYWLYADAGGTVRAVAIERRPSDSPFRTFQRGVDLLMQGAPQRVRDGSQVKNRWTVRGAATGVEGAQLYDTFQADHALYAGVVNEGEYTSELLEYIADVTAVASRMTALWNRRPNIVRYRIKGDPRLRVGMTVGITDSGIGYSSAQNFFIYALDTEYDGASGKFDQQVVLDGGVGSAGYTTIPNPVAVIAYTLERETVDGTALTIIRCDGSGSYSLADGEIVSWQWSTSDTPYSGTASGSSSPHDSPTYTFIIPDTEAPFTISLVVTDTTSKQGTDTVDITIPLSGDVVAPASEAVHAAGGSVWLYTPDGGATVTKEVRTTTIVAEGAGVWASAPDTDAAGYGALGVSGAQLRQTLDGLATTSTLLSTAGGSITAVYVNPRNAGRVWRAVGTALYRSVDGGTTFAAWGTLPATVNCIIEDPALDNSVFVAAGANLYNTYRADGTSPGSSWSTLYAGPSGATARWFVRSDDGATTWVAYTGTFTGSPVQRVEGGVSATGITGECRALALLQSESGLVLVAVDDASPPQAWYGPATTGALSAGPTLPSGSTAQHATGSRLAPIAYIADFDSEAVGTGALRKLVLGQGTGVLLPWLPGATGEQYHMVQLAAPVSVVSAYLLRPTWGVSPGGVYLYDPTAATWTLKNSGLPSGWYWVWVSADPFNPARWIMAGMPTSTLDDVRVSGGVYKAGASGQSPYWLTEDSGATWTALSVTAPNSNTLNSPMLIPRWSETTGGLWYAAGTRPGVATDNVLVRGTTSGGTGTTLTSITLATDGAASEVFAGQSDDVIVTMGKFSTSGEYALRYAGSSGGGTTRPSGTALTADIGLDRQPAGRGLIVTVGTALYRTTDYRAAQPTSISLSGANSVALAGSRAYIGTAASGLKEILDPWGTPSLGSTRIGAGYAVVVRSARQGRAGVVLVGGTINASGSPNMIIADAVGAREINGPAVSASDLSAGFDVFVR